MNNVSFFLIMWWIVIAVPKILRSNAFDKLMQAPGVFIKENFQSLEAISGFEIEKKYYVFATD